MNNLNEINKHYVSKIDEFLAQKSKEFGLSASQQREISKHERIFEKRDNPEAGQDDSEMWGDF